MSGYSDMKWTPDCGIPRSTFNDRKRRGENPNGPTLSPSQAAKRNNKRREWNNMAYEKLIPCDGRMVSINRASALKGKQASLLSEKRKQWFKHFGNYDKQPTVDMEKYLYEDAELPKTAACDKCGERVTSRSRIKNGNVERMLCEDCYNEAMLYHEVMKAFK